MGSTERVHSRAVYTFWDLMGDVGGLHDALVIFASWVMSISTFFAGSGLDRYLVSNLFKVEPKEIQSSQISQIRNEHQKNRINIRKPA